MKAKVILEFEVGDLVQFEDPNASDCKHNIIDVMHGMVLNRLDTKLLAMSQGAEHGVDEHYIKALEDDLTLARRIMNGIKFIGGIDEDAENTV